MPYLLTRVVPFLSSQGARHLSGELDAAGGMMAGLVTGLLLWIGLLAAVLYVSSGPVRTADREPAAPATVAIRVDER